MRVVYHPKVYSDLSAIMGYYEEVATAALADEFYREFKLAVKDAVQRPESFRVRTRDLRRVNLPRFPFHFLFRIVDDSHSRSGGSPPQEASFPRDSAPLNSVTGSTQ